MIWEGELCFVCPLGLVFFHCAYQSTHLITPSPPITSQVADVFEGPGDRASQVASPPTLAPAPARRAPAYQAADTAPAGDFDDDEFSSYESAPEDTDEANDERGAQEGGRGRGGEAEAEAEVEGGRGMAVCFLVDGSGSVGEGALGACGGEGCFRVQGWFWCLLLLSPTNRPIHPTNQPTNQPTTQPTHQPTDPPDDFDSMTAFITTASAAFTERVPGSKVRGAVA
jgi:hypothetical protein